MTTRKLILCLDYSEQYDLRGVRVLDPDTLHEVATTGLGAYKTFSDAIERLPSISEFRRGVDGALSPPREEVLCQCWNEGQYGRVHREDCPIHKDGAR